MFKGKKILLTAALLTGLFSFGVIDHVDAAPVKNYSVKTLKNDSRVFAVDKSIETKFVTFKNRFGIELAGHMYLPKNFNAYKKYPALAVCGAFGAVKEQISGLYAQQMAERGFIAVAFDPSFALCCVAGYQYRRFQRRRRLFERSIVRRSRSDWYHRHLRLGRIGAQRGGDRHSHQGDGGNDHVRYEPRHCQRLFRL